MFNRKVLFSGVLLIASATPLFAQTVPVKNLPYDREHAPNAGKSDLAPPAHPATPEQIREYLTVTHSDETAHKLMAQSLQAMRAAGNPAIPAVVWEEMGDEFAKFDLITPMISSYQRYLSQEDLAAAIAFYRTDAGQRILASQPYIISAAQDSLRKMGQDIGRQIVERHKSEIEARSKELDAEAATRANGSSAKPEIVMPSEGKK